jgi:hypothetical protein
MRPTDDWYFVVLLAKVRLNQPKNPPFSCLCPVGMGFSNVAHNAGVLHQVFDVLIGERGDGVHLEVVERASEGRAFAQDGGPGEPGLETLQRDALINALLAADRHAPFGVVVLAQQRIGGGPGRPGQAVLAEHDAGSGFLHGLILS